MNRRERDHIHIYRKRKRMVISSYGKVLILSCNVLEAGKLRISTNVDVSAGK